MKNALVLALVSLASPSAFAAPKTATITRMDLDANAFGNTRIQAGVIVVNTATRHASITLYPSNKCPPNRVCPRVIRAPIVLSLPLVSRRTNSCQAVVYTAQSDNRMADGLFQKIVITDNSTNRCPTIRIMDPVNASYETEGYSRSGVIRSYSTFSANAFVSAVH